MKHLDILINSRNTFEFNYASFLKHVLLKYQLIPNRTGIKTKNIFGVMLNFNQAPLFGSDIPLMMVHGKRVYPKMALTELLWMLQGKTDVKWLRDHNVTYWDEWELEDGTIGKSYGAQYRNFNGVDQLKLLFENFTTDLFSRRHVISLWNVNELNQMALAPCMFEYTISFEYETIFDGFVNKKVIKHNLHAHLRSNDAFLGAPYDFLFCSWFNWFINGFLKINKKHILENNSLSDVDDFVCGSIYYIADNFHIYENQISQTERYISNVDKNQYNYVSMCSHEINLKSDILKESEELTSFEDYLQLILTAYENKEIEVVKKFNNLLKSAQEFVPEKITAPIAI